MDKILSDKNKPLPIFFKPLLWSYNFSEINAGKHKETIIVNAINYGDLKHWRWIIKTYGRRTIIDILKKIPATELRPRVLRLISAIFSVKKFNYVPRGIK